MYNFIHVFDKDSRAWIRMLLHDPVKLAGYSFHLEKQHC